MESLNSDIERYIVEFCDEADCIALEKTSKFFAEAVKTGKLSWEGRFNGPTFSLKTHIRNGPVFMPFLKTIDLTFNTVYTNMSSTTYLSECLEALRVPFIIKMRAKVHLIISSEILTSHVIRNFINSISWASITCNDNLIFDLNVSTLKLNCQPRVYLSNIFRDVETLILMSTGRTNFASSMTKIIGESKMTSLTLYGVMTEYSMGINQIPCKSLKHVTLFHQSYRSWSGVHFFQRATPNLESLKISSSNLISSDFDCFDWALWPDLKKLDIENNFTFLNNRHINWPPKLKSLCAANTGLVGTSWVPSGLSELTADIHLNNDWAGLIHSESYSSLRVVLKHYYNSGDHDFFWKNMLGIKSICLKFMEYFGKDHLYKRARSELPMSLISEYII